VDDLSGDAEIALAVPKIPRDGPDRLVDLERILSEKALGRIITTDGRRAVRWARGFAEQRSRSSDSRQVEERSSAIPNQAPPVRSPLQHTSSSSAASIWQAMAPEPESQYNVLVETPARLYGF
jgi:hypothetical protein